MTVVTANPRERALENNLSLRYFRLRDPHTGALLHIDGRSATHDKTFSWLGTVRQIKALRASAKAQRRDFPYRPVPRAIIDRNRPADLLDT